MANKREQIIQLSKEDRSLIKEAIKQIKFFSWTYLILWVIMCLTLFYLAWMLFGPGK